MRPWIPVDPLLLQSGRDETRKRGRKRPLRPDWDGEEEDDSCETDAAVSWMKESPLPKWKWEDPSNLARRRDPPSGRLARKSFS